MDVRFREYDPFDLWFWIEFATVPSQTERQYVEEVFNSWFYLGQLGGFNAENLQIQEAGWNLSYLEYDADTADRSMMAVMHNMGEFDYQGTWGRCWFDLGTSDAIALDVLVNALHRLSGEYVQIQTLYIGGQNSDWLVEDGDRRSIFSEP